MVQRSADPSAGSSVEKLDNLMAGPSVDSKADKMENSLVVLMAVEMVEMQAGE